MNGCKAYSAATSNRRPSADAAVRATTVLKVVYLNTAVLVATLDGANPTTFPELRAVAAACRKMTLIETDGRCRGSPSPETTGRHCSSRRRTRVMPSSSPGALVRDNPIGSRVQTRRYFVQAPRRRHKRLGGDRACEETRPENRSLPDRSEAREHVHGTDHRRRETGAPARKEGCLGEPSRRVRSASWAKLFVSVVNSEAVDNALAKLTLETRDD